MYSSQSTQAWSHSECGLLLTTIGLWCFMSLSILVAHTTIDVMLREKGNDETNFSISITEVVITMETDILSRSVYGCWVGQAVNRFLKFWIIYVVIYRGKMKLVIAQATHSQRLKTNIEENKTVKSYFTCSFLSLLGFWVVLEAFLYLFIYLFIYFDFKKI